jgi:DNA replication protein DnaC
MGELVEEARAREPALGEALAEAERHAAERAVADLAARLGRRYAPDRATLEGFEVYHRDQRPVLGRLREIRAELPGWLEGGRGLVFYGTVGTGKDHLLAAMLYAAARAGLSCRWENGQDLHARFRDQVKADGREEDVLAPLVAPQVLAVSDPTPPAGQLTPWNQLQLYRLFDRRYRALRSTWVTLNASSVSDADAQLSEPVFDRLRHGAELLPCFWPSYRERGRTQAS